MTPFQANVLLVGASTIAGGLNSVAGGGSFLTFPALLVAGIPPIPANATSTVALWPGSVASSAGYRREVLSELRVGFWLGLPSLIGGGVGAILLVRTPQDVFNRIIPVLLFIASLIFTLGGRLKALFQRHTSRPLPLWVAAIVQLPIAIYGGYFGGGMGLVMLAVFALCGMSDIHRMNGLKSLLAALVNGVAIGTFMLSRLIVWKVGLLMIGGAVLGGYSGAAVARAFRPERVRAAVVVYAWALTAYFFFRTY